MKYTPSINIEDSEFNSRNYIVTNNARHVVGKIVDSYNSGIHSFNIIGSYGTGKSNFILALEDSLVNNSKLIVANSGQFNGLTKFKFIKIVGDYCSAETLIHQHLFRTSKNNFFEDLKRYFDNLERKGEFAFLIIDEFGKVLEYAAKNNPERELYLLQKIGEFINNPKRNAILLTTLHQNFNSYGKELSESQKHEWTKIKGRFKEIVFNEPVEQLLYLAARKIESEHRNVNNNSFKELYQLAQSTRFASSSIKYETAEKLYPLDLFAAQAITLSIQRYGQNERSLFSFLEATGQGSLQEFKDSNNLTFNLAEVYDYDLYNFHSYLSDINSDSASWTMMKVAIERVEGILEGKEAEEGIKLVKTIGMMNLFGNAGVHLSKKELSFYANHALDIENPEAIIDLLTQYKIIRYAEYKSQYILFEGTDVNIEGELLNASGIVPRSTDIIDKLLENFNLPVEFANAAYFKTGTPRYFEYYISDKPISKQPEDEIDGFINLIFNEDINIDDVKRDTSDIKEAILYAYFNNTEAIIDHLWKLDKLFYVQNIIDSQDKVAQKEISSLISHEREILNSSVLDTLFGFKDQVTWIFQGEEVSIKSKTDFNKMLSSICDVIYSSTPVFINEMINKHKPSSTMGTARNKYLEALLNSYSCQDLGFEDTTYPPEKTLYLTLLKNTGIHRKFLGAYELGEPKEETFTALWNASEEFLNSTKEKPRKLAEFIKILSSRPFKLKKGFIELWLPTYLIIKKNDYSLYDSNDVYIPTINKEVLDILQKSPGGFCIKAFNVEGVKLDLFNKYREAISMDQDEEFTAESLIQTIRPFLMFYKKLNKYAKHTKKLSKTTIKFRNALATAKDPEKTFFEELPRALGFRDSEITTDDEVLKRYVELLQNAIRELRSCYVSLIKRLENAVVKALRLKSDQYCIYKKELLERYSSVKTYLLTESQKTFLTRILTDAPDRMTWYQSLSYVILDKKLENLLDEEENYLIENMIHSFKELEKYIEISRSNLNEDDKFFRFEMISSKGAIAPRIIRLSENREQEANSLEKRINDLLSGDNEIDSYVLLNLIKKKFENE